MKWVKIEDGCEMPENGEVVLLCDDEGDWCQACRTAGAFMALDEDRYTVFGMIIDGATHWARVELPEE